MKNISENVIQKLNELAQNIKPETNNELKIHETEDKIRCAKNNIKNAESFMNDSYVKLRKFRTELEVLKEQMKQKTDFTSEIRNILSHDTVKSMNIEGKKVVILTNRIDIDDGKGNNFKGNEYEITFNYENFSVRFKGKEGHRGYWTNHDPHPHIDGNNGMACLGDAGSMLAITLNEFELYASYIIALNFLQQVNVEDPAGRRILNWDCIDKNGNVIENPYRREEVCKCCGQELDELDEDDVYECDDCGGKMCYQCKTWVENGNKLVCNECLDDYICCYECDDYFNEDEMVEVEGQEDVKYCKECAENNFNQCIECEKYMNENNTFYYEGDCYCEECYEKIKNEEDEF